MAATLNAARPNQPGYWQIDTNEKQITAKYPANWAAPPVLMGDDLLMPDLTAAEGPRLLTQPLGGGPDRVLAYVPAAVPQNGRLDMGLAVNPKTGEVIYVATVQSDTNIDLLTLTRR